MFVFFRGFGDIENWLWRVGFVIGIVPILEKQVFTHWFPILTKVGRILGACPISVRVFGSIPVLPFGARSSL